MLELIHFILDWYDGKPFWQRMIWLAISLGVLLLAFLYPHPGITAIARLFDVAALTSVLLIGLEAANYSFRQFRSVDLTGCLSSEDAQTVSEKVARLKPYMTIPTRIHNLAYRVIYVSDPASEIGADWDISCGVKLNAPDVPPWIKDLVVSAEPARAHLAWGQALLDELGVGGGLEEATVYFRPGVNLWVIVYPKSGILLKRSSSRPLDEEVNVG